ncbi:MAG: dTDP-4-dehydrorhamnose reductase [Thiothrix sp.]|nr:MAG: dTDP-4-dehydrorhamnose reductase [Thiothrix sp.]
MMKILVTGANGQLGWELQRAKPDDCELTALSRDQLDITDLEQVNNTINSIKPDWIINAAAYTAVDKAESDSQGAYAINADGAANLATAAQASNARLLHISTDFIFDGINNRPYLPEDTPNPLGVYGASKLVGEQKVRELLGDDTLIIRTAWVYSSHGNNFVKTMLRLMAERDTLGVVEDQVGTPSWAAEIARAIYLSIENNLRGIYHWTDTGAASWYDFSVAIYELGKEAGLLSNSVTINPIPTEDYPTPAVRPPYSILNKDSLRKAINYTGKHWRDSLSQMILEIKNG